MRSLFVKSNAAKEWFFVLVVCLAVVCVGVWLKFQVKKQARAELCTSLLEYVQPNKMQAFEAKCNSLTISLDDAPTGR